MVTIYGGDRMWVLIVIISGVLGWYLDVIANIDASYLFWLIGVITGLTTGILQGK